MVVPATGEASWPEPQPPPTLVAGAGAGLETGVAAAGLVVATRSLAASVDVVPGALAVGRLVLVRAFVFGVVGGRSRRA